MERAGLLFFGDFSMGAASVINRFWKNSGFKLNKYVAWFITFNFVNFSWVFFRAKTWDDAIQVLKAMLGFNGVTLPAALSTKLAFLTNFNVVFGGFSLTGIKDALIFVLAALLVVIISKNSIQLSERFKPNFVNAVFISSALLLGLISIYALKNASEFLYFNF